MAETGKLDVALRKTGRDRWHKAAVGDFTERY